MANKKNHWPDETELSSLERRLAKAKPSRGLPVKATALERIKYNLCAEFVKYCIENKISQRELASELEISEARVSEIVRYHIDKLTIDRLVKYMGELNPNFKLNIAS